MKRCKPDRIRHLPWQEKFVKDARVYNATKVGERAAPAKIEFVPFREPDWQEYMQVNNACFYAIRKALETSPHAFYSDASKIEASARPVFVYRSGGALIGAVACHGQEINNLIVNPEMQGWGYSKLLLQ